MKYISWRSTLSLITREYSVFSQVFENSQSIELTHKSKDSENRIKKLIQIGTKLEPPVNQPFEPQFKTPSAIAEAGKNPKR